MKSLRDISGICYRTEIEPYAKLNGKREFENYFRTFKKPEENVEENNFCSPFFSNNDTFTMNENYGDRVNAMEFILQALHKRECMTVYLSYDFRLAAVNEEYNTFGEFDRMKEVIETALKGTGLYLFFMVSHFNQLAGKSLVRKPEHYHIIICKERDMTKEEYESAVSAFKGNLKQLLPIIGVEI